MIFQRRLLSIRQKTVGLAAGTARALVPTEGLNAAKYFYPSHRLAQMYPEFLESEFITHYSTPWPKRSFVRNAVSVQEKYHKNSNLVTKIMSRVVAVMISTFIQVPPAFQRLVMEVFSTGGFGYIIKLHVDLYNIYPPLVIAPTFVVGLIVHFLLQSGKASKKLSMSAVYPINTNPLDEVSMGHASQLGPEREESRNDAALHHSSPLLTSKDHILTPQIRPLIHAPGESNIILEDSPEEESILHSNSSCHEPADSSRDREIGAGNNQDRVVWLSESSCSGSCDEDSRSNR
jgi:hypothetical protein